MDKAVMDNALRCDACGSVLVQCGKSQVADVYMFLCPNLDSMAAVYIAKGQLPNYSTVGTIGFWEATTTDGSTVALRSYCCAERKAN